MPIGIENKRIIVTGGARGIAAAAVQVFAKEGANVVSFDVSDDAGETVARAASAAGPGTVSYRHVNVSSRQEVFDGVDSAVAELGGLDALFNIAGIERQSPLEDLSEEDLDAVLDVNLKGTFFTNQAVFPHLKDAGGSIINFGSDTGLVPNPNGAHYSASKGGVMAFTRTAAAEWGRYGIRVNSLIPAIWTSMYDEFRDRLAPDQLAALDAGMAQMIPLGGKLGDPETDLAPVLVFLASDASKFITGQIISVNGGLAQVR